MVRLCTQVSHNCSVSLDEVTLQHSQHSAALRRLYLSNMLESKVLMEECFSSRNSRSWIVAHEFVEEIYARGAHLSVCVPNVCPPLVRPFGEGWLVVRELGNSRPDGFRGRAQLLEDLECGVDFRIAGKER